jgi:alanyl-tRNA synthetase
VDPERLRFDFAHTAPLTPEEREEVQRRVNEEIWADHLVGVEHMSRDEALAEGAVALFGEKYEERVRVVRVPGVSMELCGGTHCRHTGEIGLFQIVSETGVAAGVRRIEATTGPGAFAVLQESDRRLREVAGALNTAAENVLNRVAQLAAEREELERLLEELRREGGSGETVVVEEELDVDGARSTRYAGIRLKARNPGDVRSWGDGFLASASGQVAVVAAEFSDGKYALFAFVTDDLISLGLRADVIVRQVAEKVGGKGGGRPHMAQAGVGRPEGLGEALEAGVGVVRGLLEREE